MEKEYEVVRKEKRLLAIPPEIKTPGEVNDYFKAIAKSLPDILVVCLKNKENKKPRR